MQIVQTLPDLLLGAGIQVKRYSPGHTEQIRCPKCEGGRTREVSLSVTIDEDGHGAAWQCHRGTCGWKDGARLLRDAPRSPTPRPVQRPKADPPTVTQAVPDWLFNFFGEREIGARTIKAFGVYAVTRNYQALGGERPTIVFPYTLRGELVNRKYRPHPEKQPQQQDKDALPTLFNVDRLGDTPAEIVWVEGEPDVMALFECQIENAVTLKDGAPSSVNDANEKRFEALRTHSDLLAKAKRIVLAGDMDPPGLALREELARRLGRHRCWLVTWPEGCKDACDTLRLHGPEAVQTAVKDAQPYPITGLQRIQRGTLLALRHGRPPATMTTGTMATDAMLHLPTEGRLIIVTGFPSHGKAMALDTPIPTPLGWTTMGEIGDGDSLYAADGSVTRVAKAHPVLFDRECFRVTFRDGASFVCDAEHLWLTDTLASRMSERNHKKKRNGREETLLRGTDQQHLRKLPAVRTTREIADTLTVSDGPGKQRLNHSVRLAAAISGGAPWPLDVPPYTLGVWLGDGDTNSARFYSADPEVAEQIRLDGYEVRKNGPELNWYIQGLKGQLRQAGVLGNKHIPVACLRSPIEARLALLAGLMDTDGHQGADGVAEFCTMKPILGDAVAELVWSLGMKANIYRGRATINGKDCGEKTRICFVPTMPVFRLTRKLANATRVKVPGLRSKTRGIVSVESVPSVPVRCITVEHPDSLYLVGREFVPTHNTTWVRFVMVHTAANERRRWAVFSPEMQPWEQFAAECAEVFVGKPFWPKMEFAGMTDAEVLDAETWLRDKVTMLVCDAEDEAPTLDWILERARAAVLRDGVTDFLVDPWNEVDQQREAGVTETDYIGRSLQRLKAFGLRHGCNVWVIAHPAKPPMLKPGETRPPPGPYDISSSAHWANKADLGLTVHSPKPGTAEVHLWKPRFRRFGRRGDIAALEFDEITGRFMSPSLPPPDGLPSSWHEAEHER